MLDEAAEIGNEQEAAGPKMGWLRTRSVRDQAGSDAARAGKSSVRDPGS
jgi:hypothetical protein